MNEGKIKLPWRVRDAGAHDHETASDGDKTNFTEGRHVHILSDMATVLREGEHSHPIQAGMPTTVDDGKHVHEVIMADGIKVMTDPGGGDHKHEVLPGPRASYESGQHGHSIKMPDGKVYPTLNHAEIQMLMDDSVKKNFDIEEKPPEGVSWDLGSMPVAQDLRMGKQTKAPEATKEN